MRVIATAREDQEMDEVAASARFWGVDPAYFDVFGGNHVASEQTLERLVAAISAGRDQPVAFDTPAPQRAFQGDGRRVWGIAVQLYALRSRRNWGHGDFTDLARLITAAAAHGASAIGLNPLHALFADRAEEASPYAPNSRLFLNVLYIDVEAIPEFPRAALAGLDEAIGALRAAELIDYAGVARAKLAALHLAHRQFRAGASSERRADFQAYKREQGERLLRFACFEVLRTQQAATPWRQWPAPWRNPEPVRLAEFRQAHDEECEFQEFLQWVADRQLAACRDAARRSGMLVGLFTDLAVGIHPDGADAWMQQRAVLADVSVGAPPDEFNPSGQDWGLVPFNPQALPDNDFAVIRELMRANMRHAGALRLDHVLGLKRLFMIPRGATDGTYVRLPFEGLLRAISEESHHHRCIVIGEDLGTVPEGLRDTLAQCGLWGCRVMLFEREHGGGFRVPASYPSEAMASFNTHDLPSFRGWMESHDLRLRNAIGVASGESAEQRAQSQAALRQALAPSDGGDIAALAGFLAATPCRLAAIALDDIMGVRDQINIPGTTTQHPNWRRKLPMPIEDLQDNEDLARVAQAFAQGGRSFKA
jgi:4-alpha-glucanotransferase